MSNSSVGRPHRQLFPWPQPSNSTLRYIHRNLPDPSWSPMAAAHTVLPAWARPKPEPLLISTSRRSSACSFPSAQTMTRRPTSALFPLRLSHPKIASAANSATTSFGHFDARCAPRVNCNHPQRFFERTAANFAGRNPELFPSLFPECSRRAAAPAAHSLDPVYTEPPSLSPSHLSTPLTNLNPVPSTFLWAFTSPFTRSTANTPFYWLLQRL